ncbi:MAG: beta-propeller domain-containing protein [Ignavibacteriales bacterium]
MKKFVKSIALMVAAALMITFIFIPGEKTMAKSDLPQEAQKRLANAVVLYIGSNDAYINNAKTTIDKNIEVCPVADNGRTLVPVRFIAESLGAKVGWEPKTSTVTISYKSKKITLVKGQKIINVNGKQVSIETAAKDVNNRILVPFRAVAEALGKKVFYDRGLIVISDKDNIFNAKSEKSLLDRIIAKVNNLPTVGTEAKLKEIIEKFRTSQSNERNYMLKDVQSIGTAFSAANSMDQSASNKAKSDSASNDFSKTNVQVEGVDESDIVKTDGKYIYQVNNKRIIVADVYPANNMKVISMVKFSDANFNPEEIYIDGNKMVVIGYSYKEFKVSNNEPLNKSIRMPPYRSTSFVKAIEYDISNKSDIKKIRDFEIEGSLISSRRIGNSLYIVTNKYIDYYYFDYNLKESLTPVFYDSALKGKETNLDCSKIKCIPHCITPNYMVIAGINLNKTDEPVNIQSYLGSGEHIYSSENNLYVAVSEYENIKVENSANSNAKILPYYWNRNINTTVYKFSLYNGNATYIGKGTVPGTVLNQFSMDEYDGNFRIATTVGYPNRNGDASSKNNLYVLNDAMSITGKIEDIAPGEKIYSVRFMGNKAYMVTFKKVDPLFVIDLKNPSAPKILGKLKIPGYSDYLHPYDENHIIGFGKDAIDAKEGSFAWYQGLKIAMFDVTDVNNPKEMFKEVIGDRGTDSELLTNHKALLFSKEKNLLAFPVTLMTIKDKKENIDEGGFPEYGTFEFQGAYVYNIDLKKGFQLKARISHLTDDEYKKAGDYWYYGEKAVSRMLYIGNNLYTLSTGLYKAHDLANFKEIGSLEIK